MANKSYKYVFKSRDKSCVLSTLKQVSDISKMSYGTLKNVFCKRDIYLDKKGEFSIEKLIFIPCKSLSRR